MSSDKPVLNIRPKPPSRFISFSCLESCCFTLTDTDVIYTFSNNLSDPHMAYITMSAGGGAGGIGYISGVYFISGGGGGAGSTVQHKPVLVKPNQQLHIKIGRGGISGQNSNGEKSYLRLVEGDKVIYELFLEGGKNGHPLLCEIGKEIQIDQTTNGGKGGKTVGLIESLSGGNGKKGLIGIPSQMIALGGDGGCNMFEKGGDGGGNLLCEGGQGGNSGNTSIIGGNGQFGSGGGGSCPLSNHQIEQLSGKGGDGFAMLQLCCNIL